MVIDTTSVIATTVFRGPVLKLIRRGQKQAAETDCNVGLSLYGPPPLNFVADHPFMFMIREDTIFKIPFFVGAVRAQFLSWLINFHFPSFLCLEDDAFLV